MIHQDDRPGLFPQFLLQSMLDRPIVVFRKGRRPVDSRMPRTLKAEITPRLLRDGRAGQRNGRRAKPGRHDLAGRAATTWGRCALASSC